MLNVFGFNTSSPTSIANGFSFSLLTGKIHGDKIVPPSTKVYHLLLFYQSSFPDCDVQLACVLYSVYNYQESHLFVGWNFSKWVS